MQWVIWPSLNNIKFFYVESYICYVVLVYRKLFIESLYYLLIFGDGGSRFIETWFHGPIFMPLLLWLCQASWLYCLFIGCLNTNKVWNCFSILVLLLLSLFYHPVTLKLKPSSQYLASISRKSPHSFQDFAKLFS